MLFNSAQFLLFFPLVVLVYFVLPKKIRLYWLLIASYYFYMCWNPLYILLILTSTVLTYASGMLIDRARALQDEAKRVFRMKLWVALCFAANLSILFFFKYFNFAADSLVRLAGTAGIVLNKPKLDVLLPVGISFYTFQALSYTMDVYRQDTPVEKNIFRYALFISFFPQLVAGPIERSKNLLVQLEKPASFNFERMRSGLLMMLWGFFQKLVIADRAAILVNEVYGNYQGYAGYSIALATIFFAIQIYCDFGGYSCIAIGASEILGVKLMQNFRQPYFATSIGDFWRRWHISLSTWFRDYLYIPMGGSRCGWLRRNLNLMVTFLTSGLWHGASWSFVVWGGLNGFFQVCGRTWSTWWQSIKARLHIRDAKADSFSRKALKILVTFVLINLTWVFFRADSARQALDIFRQMFSCNNPWIFFDGSLYKMGLIQSEFWTLMTGIGVLLFVDLAHERGISLREKLYPQELWFRWVIYLLAIFSIVIFGVYGTKYDASAFIYFQF